MPRKGSKGKPNATSFKPGTSGNPGGRTRLPEDLRQARKLNQLELERAVNFRLFQTKAELEAAQADAATTMLDRLVCALLLKAAELGDPFRLELVLNRLIGRVTEKVEVKVPIPFVIKRSNGEEFVLGAAVAKEAE